ncbi:DUF1254 domain-containing protein [Pseudomonas sp. BN606]|uniref:DUF1254 domain-containing protein n=1 Tax=unclassified Pseudomonas TaxID=196821 RepID=UPI0012C724AE|nr:DUF1254 domain-containing protein [Pseudomonas sp. BN606]MDH4656899.1 DUF1254 domain-containing protein [Pseudomonas sp. BN606]MRK22156.1 DUF1254 domain-containing protein [Pseudomonas sp. JG-B]
MSKNNLRRALVVALLAFLTHASVSSAAALTPAEARAIAKEAYIYGFPLVDNYRVQYTYFQDQQHPEFKSPWNTLHNTARIYTPDDRAYPTPNADTPYSQLGADLRREPLVLTMPAVAKGRYYSAQFVDAYTHNFGYVGSRTTGNGGGTFLLAGPDWQGTVPPGIDHVFRSETQFAFVFYRTQLKGPDDLENVKRVQAGYKVQPLSAFLGQSAPAAVAAVDFRVPLSAEEERSSLEIFNQLNFVLGYCPIHPSERSLMERFARLGIGPGLTFDGQSLPADIREAIAAGIADAWRDFEALGQRVARGEVSTTRFLGSREFLGNNYLYRMRAAVTGLYGNDKEETIYPPFYLDAQGQELDASRHRYTLRFAPGQLPPVNAFWSLTLYDASRLLVANPLQRYLINSPMLPQLKRDADGGLTLYIQHQSPGKADESNWLPAPDGPFYIAGRLYWPKPEALDGRWKAPKIQRVD